MNRKNLQVFISSTYTDFIEERQAAVRNAANPQAILEKLNAIYSVTKTELDNHSKNNPDAPKERGRKPKETRI